MIRTIAAISAIAAAFAAGPAIAQEGTAEPSVNQVIVYGDQPCPEATADEIVVCVRQEDPYRIPAPLRQSQDRENTSWSERVAANAEVGNTGTLSCSPVGPGGFTGCTMDQIEQAYQERANSSDVRFGQLIAEERARRLAEIDEEAAAEQARVEQLEREYEARLRAESQAEPVPADADPLPSPR